MAGAYPRFCTAGWDATVVLRRVIPSTVMSPVPIYTPGRRETMWSEVSCPRKQHEGRD